ncbi:MAG: glycosyltransferase family 2 protein [Bacteroidetes bacterium]|nr:MAG: glycosyltransferase family 2 protein [Bacteroidota bacterium]
MLVPVFNEAAVLRQTLTELLQAEYEVIVVDDGSGDHSGAIASSLPVYYVRHAVNMGQGAALQTGMRLAQQLGARYLVHFDADGQHRCADIPALIAPLLADTADICLGSRFLSAESRNAVPPLRRWLLRAAILVNYAFTGLWLSDAHNGFRALNARAISAIELTENDMAHATEILAEISRRRLRYTEVPVQVRYTAYSLGKGQRMAHALRIFTTLLLRKLFL